ncbi:MAG: oligopeptide/dipeptide ABC transporter ATP-binding protein [Anaeroplasma sp.]
MNSNNTLLEVKGLKKYFPLQKNILGKPKVILKAVDDVSFSLETGKTIGVVGESGCGKTTLGRTILQLYDTTGGKTLYYGHNLNEFMPKYYKKEINKLPLYSKIFNHLNERLNSTILAFYNGNYKLDVNLSLNDNLNNLELLKDFLHSLDKESEEYNSTEKVYETFESLIDLLKQASISTGGFVLNNSVNAKNVILNISKNKKTLLNLSKTKKNLSSKLNAAKDDYKKNQLKELLENIEVEINKNKDELIDLINQIDELSSSNCLLAKDLDKNRENGIDLAKLTKKEMRSLRTEIQLIFQDPYSSLPPRMTIGSILTEAVKVHNIVPKNELSNYIHKVMKQCGLQPQYYDRYPHEFSGGQRQRICIARALAVNPKLVICDEPVSALDVSIQAQIINLLKELQNNLGLTYIFISHDLSVVKYITDNILVMYLGNMMELGDTDEIFDNPLHPYTKALFSAVPQPNPDAEKNRILLKGDIPSAANPPKGCKFHTRCEKCMSVCKLVSPEFIEHSPNHFVACHLYNERIMAKIDEFDEELKKQEETEKLIVEKE